MESDSEPFFLEIIGRNFLHIFDLFTTMCGNAAVSSSGEYRIRYGRQATATLSNGRYLLISSSRNLNMALMNHGLISRSHHVDADAAGFSGEPLVK